jgi:3-hydroxybutyryl-CoA dehydrogenase
MKTIQNIAVFGAGIMGRQIALNAAVNGFHVRLADNFPKACEKAEEWAKGFLAKSVEKGKTTRDAADAALARVQYLENTAEAVADCDLVIEAIIENEDIKHNLFQEINLHAPKDALITSNSSFIPSSRFTGDVDGAGRLCNLHYFNPAMLMKLVEIVRGEHTSDETVESLKAFVKAIGKDFIVVNKEIEGFVVNRLLRAVQNEAFFLYENGIASFEDIDTGAEKGLNYPMGPFRLLDLAGIDICYMNRQKTYEQTGRPEDKPPVFLEEKYNKGEFGRKTGKGWYDYSEK